MKKLYVLLASLLLVFALFSCSDGQTIPEGQDEVNENTVLKDNSYDFYALPSGAQGTSVENKMTPIALSDSAIASVKSSFSLTNISSLQKVQAEITDKQTIDFVKVNASSTNYIADYYKACTAATSNVSFDNGQGLYKVTEKGTYLFVLAEYLNEFKLAAIKLGGGSSGGDNPGGDDPVDPVDPTDIYAGGENLPVVNAYTQDNVQDGLILHAFNWGYKAIENRLDDIKAAGYSAVQVSPIQQPKDYHEVFPDGWGEQWDKLYQPLGFKIADKTWLGSKADFTSLCTKAHEKSLKVIVDIVTNHLADNSNDEDKSAQAHASLYAGAYNKAAATTLPGVKDYEPDIWAQRNNSSVVRQELISPSDGDRRSVVYGQINLPDLNTGSELIQTRVKALIKEILDCGADGFRFDAAKHIETPSDGSCASNYWPNITGYAREYAQSLNKTIYMYGEILNGVGGSASRRDYTPYMSVTDNNAGKTALNAVNSKSADVYKNYGYADGVTGDKLVLWAESHDTYADQSTSTVSNENIIKAWAMVASRANASALFLSRPGSMVMGGEGGSEWSNPEVAAVNILHNKFAGGTEYLGSSGSFMIIERTKGEEHGAVIINLNGNATSINLSVNTLPDGEYYDQVTGNKFTISNNKVTGQMGRTGIVVLDKDTSNLAPNTYLSKSGGVFDKTLTVNFELEKGATSCQITVNGVKQVYTQSGSFKLGENSTNGQVFNVKVVTVNEKGNRVINEYTYARVDGATANSVVCKDIPSRYLNSSSAQIYAWVWSSGGKGKAIKATVSGSYVIFNSTGSEDNFLLVVTENKNWTGADNQWDGVLQSKDMSLVKGNIYSVTEFK